MTKNPDGSVTFTATEYATLVMRLEYAQQLAEKVLAQQRLPAPSLMDGITKSLLSPWWPR